MLSVSVVLDDHGCNLLLTYEIFFNAEGANKAKNQ